MNILSISKRLVQRVVPLKYQLPILYCLYSVGSTVEQELLNLEKIVKTRKEGIAVDIGANVGYWSLKMANLFPVVHAFEINPELTQSLRAWANSRVIIHNFGLSDRIAPLQTLYIPVSNGLRLHGWASIEKRLLDFTDEFDEIQFPVKTLDSFKLTNVSFIKIDVEGHELAVLTGAMETIKNSKPIMVIETENEALQEVQKLLDGIGYREVLLEDIAGQAGDPQNHIFYPV